MLIGQKRAGFLSAIRWFSAGALAAALLSGCYFPPRFPGSGWSQNDIRREVRDVVANDLARRYGSYAEPRIEAVRIRSYGRREVEVVGRATYFRRGSRFQMGFTCLFDRYDGRIRGLQYSR